MGYPSFASTPARAIDAVVAGDGDAVDRALEGLTVADLEALRAHAAFLADCCEMAARGRS